MTGDSSWPQIIFPPRICRMGRTCRAVCPVGGHPCGREDRTGGKRSAQGLGASNRARDRQFCGGAARAGSGLPGSMCPVSRMRSEESRGVSCRSRHDPLSWAGGSEPVHHGSGPGARADGGKFSLFFRSVGTPAYDGGNSGRTTTRTGPSHIASRPTQKGPAGEKA